MKKCIVIIIVIVWAILLCGCDPHNPLGIRAFAVLRYSDDSKYEIIAVAPFFGPGLPSYYTTSDGGFSWKHVPFDYDSYYQNQNVFFNEKSGYYCTYECEFHDLLNNSIMYKISEGKNITISSDNGLTWNNFFELPEWTQMQKNFIYAEFPWDLGDTPNEVRGPFDAITDPETGNTYLAMGFEGIILITPDGDWKWVPLKTYNESYAQIDFPDRLGMITLIPFEDWSKAILFFLFTFVIGLELCLGRKFKVSVKVGFGVLLWLTIILTSIIGEKAIHYLAYAIVLSVIIIEVIKRKPKVNVLLILCLCSLIPAIFFLSILLCWSQGLFVSEYHTARTISTYFGMVLIVPILVIIENRVNVNIQVSNGKK